MTFKTVPARTTTRNFSHDSSGSGGSVSDLAHQARQWAEEQKRKAHQNKSLGIINKKSNEPELQGWKNEHPSWFNGVKPVHQPLVSPPPAQAAVPMSQLLPLATPNFALAEERRSSATNFQEKILFL